MTKKTIRLDLLIFCFLIASFSCKQKASYEDMAKDFKENEAQYEELYNYFVNIAPNIEEYQVTVRCESWNKVSLLVENKQGNTADKSKNIYVSNVKINSLKLASALTVVNWDKQILSKLLTMLRATEFDGIQTTGYYGKPINLSNSPTGFANSDIHIYPDSFQHPTLQPFGGSAFLDQVCRVTSSTL